MLKEIYEIFRETVLLLTLQGKGASGNSEKRGRQGQQRSRDPGRHHD
ncbi:hypothetical protein [Rhizobium sp. SJZ105]|nr:hypothetical protein [Rhizobium sp. SJZ105]